MSILTYAYFNYELIILEDFAVNENELLWGIFGGGTKVQNKIRR